ncbi:hypothetical protein, variant [Blastomyces dermatitidis ATCC 18188]|uniref:Uncharacterized protein n=1 Tax=Ajellomyces dermatitidis (strain ATCC 18188 / CBS 674.68) TaxID=653446 RepID=A0A0J9EK07_AJEDA|nr:hypothetical protein BDDG_11687 [Blastomyces dermatitidis ATCC 18188]KMW66714.1 hypothetical protein, variant [Blastomyces dermatitidis ATCC 18188]
MPAVESVEIMTSSIGLSPSLPGLMRILCSSGAAETERANESRIGRLMMDFMDFMLDRAACRILCSGLLNLARLEMAFRNQELIVEYNISD